MLRIKSSILSTFGKELLCAYGTRSHIADEIVVHLIENSLRGIDGHGINRYSEYASQLDKGLIKGDVDATVSELENAVFRVDGNGGFGITAMNKATESIERALHRSVMAVAAITGVGHTGRIGAYTERLANNYFFAAVFGGGGHKKFKSTAPFGGKRGIMGTNPVAFAVPGKNGVPVSADFSTSSTAGGKLRLARTTGVQLPPNQIIDVDGNPSTSPEAYFAGGAILPSAGSKGYGLGLICEMLGYSLLGKPHEFNWIIFALRLNAFAKPEDYASRSEEFLASITCCPPLKGFDKVHYPGEIEIERREKNTIEGIPVHPNVADAMIAAADARGVHIPTVLRKP